jgi:hypothetical protein
MVKDLRTWLGVVVAGALLGVASAGQAQPCMIFVHGKQTDTNTYTNWSYARNYWKTSTSDFVKTATKNFAASYYVVGYKGNDPWWGAGAADEVANEIINATNGGADGGGNRCARTYANGGTFWVIAHSMGGTIMDYILGNSRTTDPNYKSIYGTVGQRISRVIAVSGAHRGSQGADAVCGQSNILCNFIAFFIQSCDTATYWLRSADDVQVRTYSNSPAKNVYLVGGYQAIFGASACLSGEDDGIVQYASIYACNGSATAGYDNSNVCGNSYKQESSGFRNLDAGYENHDNIRNDSRYSDRKQIPDGVWYCNGSPCAPNTTVQSSMSTAKFITLLY